MCADTRHSDFFVLLQIRLIDFSYNMSASVWWACSVYVYSALHAFAIVSYVQNVFVSVSVHSHLTETASFFSINVACFFLSSHCFSSL